MSRSSWTRNRFFPFPFQDWLRNAILTCKHFTWILQSTIRFPSMSLDGLFIPINNQCVSILPFFNKTLHLIIYFLGSICETEGIILRSVTSYSSKSPCGTLITPRWRLMETHNTSSPSNTNIISFWSVGKSRHLVSLHVFIIVSLGKE